MPKMYIIKITDNNLGQIIDGLRCKAEFYRKLGRCYIESQVDGEIEAKHYEGIIEDLESQMKRQDYMNGTLIVNQHLNNSGGK